MSSPERASAVSSAGNVVEPARKRQKLSPYSSQPTSDTTHDTALSKTMAHNMPSDDSAFKAQLEKEVDSGILFFVNPSDTGFTGVLKQRYV